MHYFYSKLISESNIALSKEEAHHAFRVLRLQVGDKVGVFNGEGKIYHCSINEISKSNCTLLIEDVIVNDRERSKLTILIAPTKSNDRFEWFLEKATEIGVGVIIPLITEHSERKKIRSDRFEKILVSAMKQSMNSYLPVLKPLTNFINIIDQFDSYDRFISHCVDSEKKDLFDEIKIDNETVILIGPEGDFSGKEIQMANDRGWQGVSLGKQRFRTETAGIIAVHIHSLKVKP